MNQVSTEVMSLNPASPDEIRAALKALFDQFPASDGDAKGKFLGYVMGLEGEPKWAVDRGVRMFLRGEVREHNGRYLPTSAELAKVVRSLSDHARRMRDYRERWGDRRPVESAPLVSSDWKRPCPDLAHIRSWKLPTGTLIIAANATVVYPDGSSETWTEVDRRMNAERHREAA